LETFVVRPAAETSGTKNGAPSRSDAQSDDLWDVRALASVGQDTRGAIDPRVLALYGRLVRTARLPRLAMLASVVRVRRTRLQCLLQRDRPIVLLQ